MAERMIKETLYIHYLSEQPLYLICSYWAKSKLGDECLGLITIPDTWCPKQRAYAIDDEHFLLGDASQGDMGGPVKTE